LSQYIAVDHRNCTGCKTCEMVCSIHHWGESNMWKSAIRVLRKEIDGLVNCLPLVCQQCTDPACMNACPTDAISRNNGGAVTFSKNDCIDCGACIDVCPAGCVPTNLEGAVVMYCDLCDGQPMCVNNCHGHCLSVKDNTDEKGAPGVRRLADILTQEKLWDYLPVRRVNK